MKKNLRIIVLFLGVIIVVSGVVFGISVLNDCHQTNLEYIWWKKGMGHYNPDVVLRFITVDSEFRISLRGKNKDEVKKLFPDLRSPDKANRNQEYYNQYIEGIDFLWIGDSNWGIEFVNSVVKDIRLLKG